MATLKWTEEALRSLQNVHDYISEQNPGAASKTISTLLEKTETIVSFPSIGYHYRLVAEGDLRVLPSGHYRIAYIYREPDAVILIGFFHGAMEIDHYLPK